MMSVEYEKRYDEQGDTLTVKKRDESIQKSVSPGNMNIDFGTDSKVVGIQLLNASEVLLFSEEVQSPTDFLKHIQEADLRTKYFEDGSMAVVPFESFSDWYGEDVVVTFETITHNL